MPCQAFVDSVTLRLSQALAPEHSFWEVRIYNVSRYTATLKMRRGIQLDAANLDEQTVRVRPSLPVEPGQFVALFNRAGVLAIREKQEPEGSSNSQIFWTDKVGSCSCRSPASLASSCRHLTSQRPSDDIDSHIQLKRSEAPYHLGWYANLSTTGA